MLNKSGAYTLDKLKTSHGDISNHCKTLMERKEFGVGFQLLSNIKHTMSDQASTLKHKTVEIPFFPI